MAMTVAEPDGSQLPTPDASIDSLRRHEPSEVGQPAVNWRSPAGVDLPSPARLPPQPPPPAVQGPDMLTDMAERSSFALIDPARENC